MEEEQLIRSTFSILELWRLDANERKTEIYIWKVWTQQSKQTKCERRIAAAYMKKLSFEQ